MYINKATVKCCPFAICHFEKCNVMKILPVCNWFGNGFKYLFLVGSLIKNFLEPRQKEEQRHYHTGMIVYLPVSISDFLTLC